MESTWHARRYRYADGVAYKRNLYVIWDENEEVIGGAMILGSRVMAYIGDVGPNDGLNMILKVAKTVVWGSALSETLKALKAKHQPTLFPC